MGPPASKTRRFDRLIFNSVLLLSTCQVSGKIFAPLVASEMSNISVVCEEGNLAIGPNGAIEQRKYIWLPECVFSIRMCNYIQRWWHYCTYHNVLCNYKWTKRRLCDLHSLTINVLLFSLYFFRMSSQVWITRIFLLILLAKNALGSRTSNNTNGEERSLGPQKLFR